MIEWCPTIFLKRKVPPKFESREDFVLLWDFLLVGLNNYMLQTFKEINRIIIEMILHFIFAMGIFHASACLVYYSISSYSVDKEGTYYKKHLLQKLHQTIDDNV